MSRPPVPPFWMDETSGILAAAVSDLFAGALHVGASLRSPAPAIEPVKLTNGQVAVLRWYLQQWIMAPGFSIESRVRGRLLTKLIQADGREGLLIVWEGLLDLGIDPF